MKLLLNTLLALGLVVSLNLTSIQAQDLVAENNLSLSKSEDSKTEIFESYPWLKKVISTSKNNDELVSVYDQNGTKFILVESSDKTNMYDIDGKIYCYNHPTLNCKEFYKLGEPTETWTNKKE